MIIAKNYLTEEELVSLRRVVSAYLDFAKERAMRNISITMKDWEERLNKFLESFDKNVLKVSGRISHKKTIEKTEN